MNYIDLNDFKYAWIFRHQSMPLTDEQKALINPMQKDRAHILWDTFVSKQVIHPDQFKQGDWAADNKNWFQQGQWEAAWESEDSNLPETILEHLNWDPKTVVYYVINRNLVIETTWLNFKQCWKNFLFVDDSTLLIGKKRQQAVQFFNDGNFRLGNKPN